jgi:hypothetical protein
MSKALAKYSFEGEHKRLEKKVNTIGRNVRVNAKLKNVNTTGLSYPFNAASNIAIDEMVEGPCGGLPTEELNGIHIYDEGNELYFIRIKGNWKKIKLE